MPGSTENSSNTRKRKNSSLHINGSKRSSHVTLSPSLRVSRLNNSPGGVVLMCGEGDTGQLGLGSEVLSKSRPTIIPDLKNVIDVVAGGMHTLCMDNSGEMFSWGCNDDGALGRDTSEEGSEFVPVKVSLPEKIVQISAGDTHSAALTESGKAYAWGSFRDSSGDLGLTLNGREFLPVLLSENIASISSGSNHLLLLSCDGKVKTCGNAEYGQLGRIPKRSAVRGCRRGIENMLTPKLLILHPRMRFEFDEVWSGANHSFVREYDSGHIYGFGLNGCYQLGFEQERGYMEPKMMNSFSSYKPWLEICGGEDHTIAVNNKGVTYALGRAHYGRLGLGVDGSDCTVPTVIPTLEQKKVVGVSCGSSVSFAVTSDGEAYGWGMGSNCQLGLGNDDDVYEPTLVTGKQLVPNSVLKVSSGGQHTAFLSKQEMS